MSSSPERFVQPEAKQFAWCGGKHGKVSVGSQLQAEVCVCVWNSSARSALDAELGSNCWRSAVAGRIWVHLIDTPSPPLRAALARPARLDPTALPRRRSSRAHAQPSQHGDRTCLPNSALSQKEQHVSNLVCLLPPLAPGRPNPKHY
jgi:hypothetical protein